MPCLPTTAGRRKGEMAKPPAAQFRHLLVLLCHRGRKVRAAFLLLPLMGAFNNGGAVGGSFANAS